MSRPIWDRLPLLPFVQFPWRFLSVQSFFGSLLIGYLATLPRRSQWRREVAYALALLLLISAMAGLRVEYLPITDADVTPTRLALYELFTANIGSTVRAEYLPRGVEPRPFTSAVLLNGGRKPPPLATAGQVEGAQLLTQRPAEERWSITVNSPEAELAFFTLHFPGWRAYVDDRRVAVGPAPGSGFISLRVPQGQHEVVLRFWLTRRRAVAEGMSLLAGLILMGAIAWGSGTFRQFDHLTRLWARRSGNGTLLLATMAFLLSVAVLWLHTRTTPLPPSPLTMDFARIPYLHANPGGVRFGGHLRLTGYDYPDQVQAGRMLPVTLRWESTKGGHLGTGLQAEVALVSPAVHLFGVPDVLARQMMLLEAVTVHRLEIPRDVMPGLYLILIKVHNEEGEIVPRTEAGESLGTTYLRPLTIEAPGGLVEAGPGTVSDPGPGVGQFGPAIRLLALGYERISAEWLRVDLTWWAGSAVSANYKTSLRLKNDAGQMLVQVDTEPLYGFYPTTAWRPGQPVTDRRWLALPPDLPPGENYRIEVVLYEVPSLQALGTVEIDRVALPSMGRN